MIPKKLYQSFFLAFTLFTGFSSLAQVIQWEDSRKQFELTEEEKNYPAYTLFMGVQYEYLVVDGNYLLRETNHRIIRVNNDDAISENNRIVIPLGGNGKLSYLKARTIQPDGTVVDFDQNEIKEIEDEQLGRGYKIFAIEGATKNSEIEYFYQVEKSPDIFLRNFFQFKEPVKRAVFRLVSPSKLVFDVKPYNGFGPLDIQLEDGENIYLIQQDDIPGYESEEFSSYNNNRMRVDGKLKKNLNNSGKEVYTWADLGKAVYDRLFVLDPKEQKAVEKWIKKAKLSKEDDEEKFLVTLDDQVKRTVAYESNAPGENVVELLENRYGNKMGLTKLYLSIMKFWDIDVKLVLAADLNNIEIDPDFQSWTSINEYLIYLPTYDKYISPYEREHRYGTIPENLQDSQAYFVEEVSIQGISYPIGKFEHIPELPGNLNLSRMDMEVNFSDDDSELMVDYDRTMSGNEAYFLKAIYDQMDADRQKDILDTFVKRISENTSIENIEITQFNKEPENWLLPLKLKARFTSENFIETAGNIRILKVGELIGAQSELYQEKERTADVRNLFNRIYEREIVIHIPEGMKVRNPDDLILNVEARNDQDEVVYYFYSKYTLEGGKLIISVDEGYEQMFYPAKKFDEFRKVINAAADWNKVKLIIEPES